LGSPVSVLRDRGPMAFETGPGFLTVHPSYILRLPEDAQRDHAFQALVADLKRVAQMGAQMEAQIGAASDSATPSQSELPSPSTMRSP
jgi:hypothetical protein